MRDYQIEYEKRIEFIRKILINSGAKGIIFGNSGGKDSALVGALCKAASDNTIGVIMPCGSKRNFNEDKEDGLKVANHLGITTKIVDLTPAKEALVSSLQNDTELSQSSSSNIAPRLRMITLYAIARDENLLVAGTGNRSEIYMGYFTKWGDGACDFNPISDLTVTEIYEFMRYLKLPQSIIDKAPSAGLFDGQTDETEMGVTYGAIDEYILNGNANYKNSKIIEKYHQYSEHKRLAPTIYKV